MRNVVKVVAPRIKRICIPVLEFPLVLRFPLWLIKIKTLLVSKVGVIVAVKVVSTKVSVELTVCVVVVALTTCNTLPPALDVAHSGAVAPELT